MDPPANRFTKLQQSFFFSLYTKIPVYPHSPLRFPYQFPFLSRLKRKKLSSSLQLPYQREFDCISNRTVAMNSRRDYRGNRSALFDGIEEGGIRASSSYSSHEIDEHDNDNALDGLQDRVIMLKRLTGDIHEEVESHNHMLDGMGNEMDSSRGILSGTMDRFKTVFEKKSSRRMATLVASFVVIFLIVYYLTR